MAYALRYYKEIAQADGSACRLEIYKKDSTASAVEIGAVVQGLSLEIQGQQGDVDSPIVKTSLSMTFVDAGDLENGQKNGFWEEFYTPDALMWKVVLKVKDAQETAFRTMWGGYVTPDSFSENLVYRGSVTIIARDNIGHMQDFPFDAQGDADGLISLYNLVNMAWEKIQSPMDLEWNPNQMMVCDGVPAYDTLMNVSQFEGMDWYKAVESALASYGMVMRFVGDNAVHIGALRFLPNLGWVSADSVPHMEPRFISGATRELVPAVRRIEESVDYEAGEVNAPQVDSSDFTGDINSTLLTTSTGVQFRLYSWNINNTEEGEGWVDNGVSAPYFNPEGYDMAELIESDSHDGRFMWLAFSQYITGDNRYALYSRRMMAGRIDVRFAFGPTYRLVNSKITPIGSARADYAVVAIEVVSGSSRYFLQEDGTWGSALDMLTYRGEQMQDGELVLDLPTDEFDGGVILNIRIYEAGYYSWSQDSYVPLYALSFTANNVMMEKNTVNTIYNADNNVILSRSPEIGPAYDRVSFPGFIKNGIFLRDGDEILPAKKWGWSGGTMQQMAVFNHLQLLSYFAKPNNLISGTIVNADITRVGVLYQWHGAEHMLMSGRYNFLNGFIESAVLREFARYEDMWSEVAGAALPETEEEGTTNVESGASSGGSSPTYTNTTTVNIGTGGSGGGGASYLGDLGDVDVTGVVAQSVLYYNGTSWVDMTLSSLLNPFFNPYIKASDVEAALVLKADASALEALGKRVTADENNIATLFSTKADKATTLAGYGIKDAYTKTETDNLLKKYLLLEAASQTIKGDIRIEGNLIVTGDSSSGGTGDDTPAIGTVTGIKVNGQTYNPSAGIVTIPDYPTTLEWNAIGGKPSFAAVATSGKYSDLSGLPTIPSLDGYATEKWVTDKGYATATALSSGLSGKVDKVSGKGLSTNDFTTALLTKLNGIASGAQVNVQSDWNATSGDAFIKNKPTIPTVPTNVSAFTNDAGYLTSHQEVKNTGNTLSFGSAIIIGSVGGTNLTAALPSVASVKTTLGLGSLAYKSSLVASDIPALDWSKITSGKPTTLAGYGITDAYTASSIDTKLADYLPLSGGTISSTSSYAFNVKCTNSAKSVAIGFMRGDSDTGYLDYRGNSEWQVSSYTILHSGNVGNYALKYYANQGAIDFNDVLYNGIQYVSSSSSSNAPITRILVSFGHGDSAWQIAGGRTDNQLRYRGGNGTSDSWSDWKQLAFTDSNVASAQAVMTSDNKYLVQFNASTLYVGGGTYSAYSTHILGNDVRLRYGANAAIGLFLNSSGNVTIGGSDLAGAAAKLYVGGKAYAETGFLFNGYYGIWKANKFTSTAGDTAILYNATRHLLIGGNVLIGTTTDNGAKLQVDGGISTSGEVFLNHNKSIRMKGNNGTDYNVLFMSGTDLNIGYDAPVIRFGNAKMFINSSGNVGIGTTSPAYKLDVNGEIHTNSYIYSRNGLYLKYDSSAFYGVFSGPIVSSNSIASDLWVYTPTKLNLFGGAGLSIEGAVTMSSSLSVKNEIYIQNASYSTSGEGSFLIRLYNGEFQFNSRTADGASKAVPFRIEYATNMSIFNGDARINGNLIVTGDSSSGSDIRFKDVIESKRIKIDDIANAPLFTFKWNDRQDDSIHLGTSAQYWETVAPWLVKGEDFKTLDYATLGVAIGISLANKTLSHDDEIKILKNKVKALEAEINRLRRHDN